VHHQHLPAGRRERAQPVLQPFRRQQVRAEHQQAAALVLSGVRAERPRQVRLLLCGHPLDEAQHVGQPRLALRRPERPQQPAAEGRDRHSVAVGQR